MSFVNEFSTWYLRLSRERLRTSLESQAVFGQALLRFALLMAPFAPFMSERIYQGISGAKDSVHLEDWPTAEAEHINIKLEQAMDTVRQLVESGHAARKAAGIRLRQPLASVTITTDLPPNLQAVLVEELNVKQVIVGKEFALDTTLTPELVAEGTARDLMRDIQGARKKMGLTPSDAITVELPSWPKNWEEEIKRKVNAQSLSLGPALKITKL